MIHSTPSFQGLRGPVLTFNSDPFLAANPDECYSYISDGLVVIADGKIEAVGPYTEIAPRYPALSSIDQYRDHELIMPGFVDGHLHYVQSPMIGSCGDTLLDWLNQYTFPTEARFRDKTLADEVARVFMHELLRHGTTTANVFATTFATSVDALFEEADRYGARMICGKVLQDRNIPENLRDKSAEESVELSEELLLKWHRRGRLLYAVVPRFAPTSTDSQLRLAGELYQKYLDSGVYMHTHLDEAEGEIEWVKQLFPDADNYTDVYRRFGLVDRRSVFAHCCIVTPPEWETLSANECGVIHCPASNLFLGDGEFKYWEAKNPAHPCRMGIGTDIGGGTSFSIPRQLGEAYKVAMLKGHSLDALHAFYMATRGSAEALHLEDCIGSIRPGHEADIAVIDMQPTEFAAWRMGFTPADDIMSRLFILQTLGPDRLVRATYVGGMKVFDRDRPTQFAYPH